MPKAILPISLLLCFVVALTGCSKSEEQAEMPEEAPVIETIAGMRYYVGGPKVKEDRYGRSRIYEFSGRIMAPTVRGLLVGFKVDPDRNFEFMTWLNGSMMQKSSGFLDEEGLLWYLTRETVDVDGAVFVRQTFTYDNERRVMTSHFRDLDPETGEVLSSTVTEIPYSPPSDRKGKKKEKKKKNG
ncbi:MAG: hypothetical protein VCA74_03180 [Deltaproteobacteria bacterium]